MGPPRRVVLLGVALALLASCRPAARHEPAGPAPSASVAAGGAAGRGGHAAASARRPVAPLPPPLAALAARSLEEARALGGLVETLGAAIARREAPAAREALGELRRRDRALQPVARFMAKVASSQLGAYGLMDPDEMSPHAGLGALGRFLEPGQPSWPDVDKSFAIIAHAARSLPGELELQDWTPTRLGHALSEAVYTLGARLDGSDSRDEAARAGDLGAELGGLLAALDALAEAAPGEAEGLRSDTALLRALGADLAAGRPPSRLLPVLRATGPLGARVRRAFRSLGAAPIDPPFRPARLDGAADEAPVSAASLPAGGGRRAAPEVVALGEALFRSTALSRPKNTSCASCHRAERAYASGDRALTFDRHIPPRNAPGLGNVGREVTFFWDGRASTLAAQIEVAVDRDMGGDWAEIERRLAADPAQAAAFDQAFHGAPTAARVREAIVAFERTITAVDSPLDRFVQGDDRALDEGLLEGFDIYFGKGRCSRCHRLPFTSGVEPPRFQRSELNAIGVPRAPGAHEIDPDTGRHAHTHQERDRGLFKTPSLRDLALTAPYFHNGAFRTLEEVVAFYDQGAGPGLGYEVPNLDPEIRPLKLAATERARLVRFLKEGLRSGRP